MIGFNLAHVERIMSRKQIKSMVEASARINVWSGAVRSGKTVASLLRFLYAVINAPDTGRIFVIGRTIETVGRNLIEPLQESTGPFAPFSQYIHYTRGANVAHMFGRVVHLVGANDVKAEGRIRGSSASLIYIDEATLVPESFFRMCLTRLSTDIGQLFCTTNPDGPMHWLRQDYLLNEDPDLDLRQWHFMLDDNPALSEKRKRQYKAENTGLFYKRFILGLWCLAEGAVYDSWDPDLNVVKAIPPIEVWLAVGIDYGTTNPFAAEMIGLGVDGRLYVTSEYYYDSKARRSPQLDDAAYADAVKTWLDEMPIPGEPEIVGVSPKYTVVDPSAASFRTALKKVGISSYPGDNDVMDGIRTVSSLIATRRLLVHESCKSFINEIPSYCWDPKKVEKGEDAPIKVADHALDAVRYGVFTTQSVWHNRLCPPNTALVAA